MVGGPSPRYISNRIFNDVGQNLFSENDISQWGWAWGQFLDHDIGLRDETPAEAANMAFDKQDRLEDFSNDSASSLLPDSRGPGNGQPLAPAADQHAQQLHRRVQRLRGDERPARLAA